jgi:hypothetical protein
LLRRLFSSSCLVHKSVRFSHCLNSICFSWCSMRVCMRFCVLCSFYFLLRLILRLGSVGSFDMFVDDW